MTIGPQEIKSGFNFELIKFKMEHFKIKVEDFFWSYKQVLLMRLV